MYITIEIFLHKIPAQLRTHVKLAFGAIFLEVLKLIQRKAGCSDRFCLVNKCSTEIFVQGLF